jgi:quinol monooxygenase YgiN
MNTVGRACSPDLGMMPAPTNCGFRMDANSDGNWGTVMIHARLRMKFAPSKYAEARDILRAMVERTRVSRGCLGCDIYQDLREPRVLLFEEWWETEADLDRHLRSDTYRHVILVMEMALEYPVLRFNEVSHSTGLETVERARSGLGP